MSMINSLIFMYLLLFFIDSAYEKSTRGDRRVSVPMVSCHDKDAIEDTIDMPSTPSKLAVSTSHVWWLSDLVCENGSTRRFV